MAEINGAKRGLDNVVGTPHVGQRLAGSTAAPMLVASSPQIFRPKDPETPWERAAMGEYTPGIVQARSEHIVVGEKIERGPVSMGPQRIVFYDEKTNQHMETPEFKLEPALVQGDGWYTLTLTEDSSKKALVKLHKTGVPLDYRVDASGRLHKDGRMPEILTDRAKPVSQQAEVTAPRIIPGSVRPDGVARNPDWRLADGKEVWVHRSGATPAIDPATPGTVMRTLRDVEYQFKETNHGLQVKVRAKQGGGAWQPVEDFDISAKDFKGAGNTWKLSGDHDLKVWVDAPGGAQIVRVAMDANKARPVSVFRPEHGTHTPPKADTAWEAAAGGQYRPAEPFSPLRPKEDEVSTEAKKSFEQQPEYGPEHRPEALARTAKPAVGTGIPANAVLRDPQYMVEENPLKGERKYSLYDKERKEWRPVKGPNPKVREWVDAPGGPTLVGPVEWLDAAPVADAKSTLTASKPQAAAEGAKPKRASGGTSSGAKKRAPTARERAGAELAGALAETVAMPAISPTEGAFTADAMGTEPVVNWAHDQVEARKAGVQTAADLRRMHGTSPEGTPVASGPAQRAAAPSAQPAASRQVPGKTYTFMQEYVGAAFQNKKVMEGAATRMKLVPDEGPVTGFKIEGIPLGLSGPHALTFDIASQKADLTYDDNGTTRTASRYSNLHLDTVKRSGQDVFGVVAGNNNEGERLVARFLTEAIVTKATTLGDAGFVNALANAKMRVGGEQLNAEMQKGQEAARSIAANAERALGLSAAPGRSAAPEPKAEKPVGTTTPQSAAPRTTNAESHQSLASLVASSVGHPERMKELAERAQLVRDENEQIVSLVITEPGIRPVYNGGPVALAHVFKSGQTKLVDQRSGDAIAMYGGFDARVESVGGQSVVKFAQPAVSNDKDTDAMHAQFLKELVQAMPQDKQSQIVATLKGEKVEAKATADAATAAPKAEAAPASGEPPMIYASLSQILQERKGIHFQRMMDSAVVKLGPDGKVATVTLSGIEVAPEYVSKESESLGMQIAGGLSVVMPGIKQIVGNAVNEEGRKAALDKYEKNGGTCSLTIDYANPQEPKLILATDDGLAVRTLTVSSMQNPKGNTKKQAEEQKLAAAFVGSVNLGVQDGVGSIKVEPHKRVEVASDVAETNPTVRGASEDFLRMLNTGRATFDMSNAQLRRDPKYAGMVTEVAFKVDHLVPKVAGSASSEMEQATVVMNMMTGEMRMQNSRDEVIGRRHNVDIGAFDGVGYTQNSGMLKSVAKRMIEAGHKDPLAEFRAGDLHTLAFKRRNGTVDRYVSSQSGRPIETALEEGATVATLSSNTAHTVVHKVTAEGMKLEKTASKGNGNAGERIEHFEKAAGIEENRFASARYKPQVTVRVGG